MEKIVYLNGHYLPAEEAKVSVFDRGFLFGDGIYEVLPVIRGRLVDRQYCLERLNNSLQAIALAWPCERQEFLAILEALVSRNQLQEGYVYTQITRGWRCDRSFNFPADDSLTMMAFCSAKNILQDPQAGSGVAVVTVEEWRWKRRDIKSVNLLAQCLGKQEAVTRGAFEGWMVEDGVVTEGTSSSAFIVKNQCLITRPLSTAILPGIRRRVVLEFAESEGIAVQQRNFSVAEALAADEAFLSSATTLVLPVTRIDGKAVGNGRPGPLSLALRERYVAAVIAEAEAQS